MLATILRWAGIVLALWFIAGLVGYIITTPNALQDIMTIPLTWFSDIDVSGPSINTGLGAVSSVADPAHYALVA